MADDALLALYEIRRVLSYVCQRGEGTTNERWTLEKARAAIAKVEGKAEPKNGIEPIVRGGGHHQIDDEDPLTEAKAMGQTP